MQFNLKSGLPRMTLSVFKSLQDSQDLFDFQSPIAEEIYIVNDSAHIYRKRDGYNVRGKKVKVVTQRDAENGDLPDFNFQMLFSLKIKNFRNQFQYLIDRPETSTAVIHTQIEQFHALPFIGLSNHGRSNQITTYKLKEGNILKFGKIFFRIVQSRGGQALLPNTIIKKQSNQPRDNIQEQNQQSKVCRICLQDREQEENDLISPCDCKGSCRYVHLSCLQTWISSKVVRRQNSLVTSYSLAKFQCEICKKSLPNCMKVNEKTHQLVQFHKPNNPYLVLERLQHNSRDKIIYVLTPNSQPVRIGRASSLQMRINDISISRVHASIEFNDGCFYLKDLGSKFGSLISIQQKVDINQVMCLQYGSKLYKMEVMPYIHSRAMAYV